MQYNDFGKTGIKVSALGLGAMRLPTIGEEEKKRVDMEASVPVIRKALDLGINYIDSAFGYLNGTSENAVGEAIKGYDRSKIHIATKVHLDTDFDSWCARLETQLKRLDTDYIDFYHFHGLQWREFAKKVKPEGFLKEMEKARDQGLIRHISFSCHDAPSNMLRLIDTGIFSSMLVQYNLLHRMTETAIERAHEKGMGVVVMGPVGGGRLHFMSRLKPRENRTVPELALRFGLSNPSIDVVLSGMNTVEMVEENVKTAENTLPLSTVEGEDIQHMLDQLKGLEDLYCTGCDYCMPCPNGVNIPINFNFMNYERFYEMGQADFAKLYHKVLKPAGIAADSCLECEECVEKCPQNIPIPECLKEVDAHFEKKRPN
ncbi:MAG: aldo/keto reductase [Proteobacteria bacterium]|nr:aldo/keto reductase [Pseudomonadota bacterium]